MDEIKDLKNNIKELVDELNERIKYMDEANIKSIIRLSAWIHIDANRIIKIKK